MPEGTYALIHQPAHLVYQNLREAEQNVNILKAINESLKAVYLKYINITDDELDTMIASETILTSEHALKIGFATSNKLPQELKIDSSVAYANRIENTHNFLEVQKNLYLAKQNEIFNEVTMTDKNKELLEAKLEAAESAKIKIEAEFNAYKAENEKIDIDAIKNQAKAEVLEELKKLSQIQNKAISFGFKAEGDTTEEVMKNILIEASISKERIETFDNSQLEILVDYVMSTKKEVDDYSTLANSETTIANTKTTKTNRYSTLGSSKGKGK